MKTSNILFIILLGIVLTITTAFMIDIRLKGRLSTDERADSFEKMSKPSISSDIESFSHVMINDVKSIALIGTENNTQLEAYAIRDSIGVLPNHSVSNDTLFITGTEIVNAHYELLNGRKIKSITLKNSTLSLKSFNQDSLSVTLFKSALSSGDSTSYCGRLFMNVNQRSQITWLEGELNDVTLLMNSSNADFHQPLKKIDAQLESSELQILRVNSIRVEKGDNSTFTLYE